MDILPTSMFIASCIAGSHLPPFSDASAFAYNAVLPARACAEST